MNGSQLAFHPLPTMVKNTLKKAGIDPNDIDLLCSMTSKQLFTLPGFSYGSLGKVRAYLASKGRRLADEADLQPLAKRPVEPKSQPTLQNGISRRDWFAGQAVGSVMHLCARDTLAPSESLEASFARKAYAIADAMLAESAKGGGQ